MGGGLVDEVPWWWVGVMTTPKRTSWQLYLNRSHGNFLQREKSSGREGVSRRFVMISVSQVMIESGWTGISNDDEISGRVTF